MHVTSEGLTSRFYEPGARWRTVAFGPVFCAGGLAVEVATGPVVHWVALPVVALVLAGFTWVMVVAARRHVSVELTGAKRADAVLRSGPEERPSSEIEAVLPPAVDSWDEPQRWESARPLGELANVPRGRTAVGLRLKGGTFVRAWAKDADLLRVRLEELVSR
ncbi:hypothetical protein [Rhodococcus chondri]|uniref:DUF3093 domain-containing protein n=1 Tax=Rhodococcus chondri TaxID=3065941 RepID=A0ABU7JU83_9NOCA|nr:hypothetical protein [Rhodococcus sp. CC-R104]MEE2033591.1 hypothetical protein [Rhodococcus sp. CC-R104]